MKTIKGPGVFLAQFARDEAPFDTIEGLAEGLSDGFQHGREVNVVATKPDGTEHRFTATVRIDTPQEIRYYQHGGILPYVLRQLLGTDAPPR